MALLVNLIISVLVPSVAGKVRGQHSSARLLAPPALGCSPSAVARHLHPPPPPQTHAQLVRDLCAPVRRFVTKYKVPLSLFSTANLAFIVWQVLSSAQSTREAGGGRGQLGAGSRRELSAPPACAACCMRRPCPNLHTHPPPPSPAPSPA